MVKVRCPVCLGKTKFFRTVVGNINFPEDKTLYALYKCVTCGHIFRTNFLSKTIYNSDYYSYSASKNWFFDIIKFIYLYSKMPVFNILWWVVQNSTRYQNCPYVKNGSVLDIGGGDGFVLNLYALSNNKTYNIELLNSVRKLSRENGHKTFSNINQIKGMKFDLIRINHVLEHLIDPFPIVEKSFSLLKKNGRLVIGIPNIHSLSFKILRDKFDQLSFPDHFHFFSEKSLKILLKAFYKVKIIYPLHKYGVSTNIYTIFNKKLNITNTMLFYIPIMLFGFPINIISKSFKATHLINIYCEKK